MLYTSIESFGGTERDIMVPNRYVSIHFDWNWLFPENWYSKTPANASRNTLPKHSYHWP